MALLKSDQTSVERVGRKRSSSPLAPGDFRAQGRVIWVTMEIWPYHHDRETSIEAITAMRTVVFNVARNISQNRYEAISRQPPLQIKAPTMEELHIEARDVLIQELGPIHVAFRIKFAVRAAKPPASHRTLLVGRAAAQPSGLQVCL